LREGGVGQFILPSAYAFGARGVPGVVDPYTPVLYRVSVVRVGR
jgi:FKBP-type peptidyl-prolyl cis-trans isomerase